MTFLTVIVAAAAGVIQTFGIRIATEMPAYDVAGRCERLEIRRYAAQLVAETDLDGDAGSARSEGFRRLAAFIFGANRSGTAISTVAPVAESGTAIDMTAPVAETSTGDGRWRVRFVMPAEYTAATLPRPTDPRVQIVAEPAALYAVWRFTGDRSPAEIERRQAELLAGLEACPWRPHGTAVAWFYDPPWTIPFLRRNEVAVPVVAAAE